MSRDHLAKVVDSYLCGDIASVVSEFSGSLHTTKTSADGLDATEVATLGAVENHFKDELLLRRNGAMAREIGRLLRRRTNESLFFALGAGGRVLSDLLFNKNLRQMDGVRPN